MANRLSKYSRDTAIVGGGQIISHAISYCIIVLLTRTFGAEGLGQYSFALSLPIFFFVFSDFGMTYFMVREAGKDPSLTEGYYSNIYSARLFLVLILYAIYVCSVLSFFHSADRTILLTGGAIVALDALKPTPYALLRINHHSLAITQAVLVERIVALLAIFCLLFFSSSLKYVMLALLASRMCEVAIATVSGRHFGKPFRFEININRTRLIIRESYPFMLVLFFSTIYVQLDTVMLSFMKGDVVTGWYNAPYKLIAVLNIVPQMLMLFGFPLFAKIHDNSPSEFKKLFLCMNAVTLSVMIPAIITVWVKGHVILSLIYGFNTAESFNAFKVLIVAQLFVILTTIMGQIIAAMGRQHLFALITGSGALFNIIVNFLLIPRYSLIGAGFATLATYFAIAIIEGFVLAKHIKKMQADEKAAVPASPGASVSSS